MSTEQIIQSWENGVEPFNEIPPLNERLADEMFYQSEPVSETEEQIKAIAADIGWINLTDCVQRLRQNKLD